jgi:hypothetical protein
VPARFRDTASRLSPRCNLSIASRFGRKERRPPVFAPPALPLSFVSSAGHFVQAILPESVSNEVQGGQSSAARYGSNTFQRIEGGSYPQRRSTLRQFNGKH